MLQRESYSEILFAENSEFLLFFAWLFIVWRYITLYWHIWNVSCSLTSKIFASGLAIRATNHAVLRPSLHGSFTSQTQNWLMKQKEKIKWELLKK